MIKPILAQYIPMADMVVKTFGEDVEVVLHDLSTPQHSVVYVANNRVTGRQVGESFQHLVSKALHASDEEKDVIANYYYHKDGRLIRSSSMLIRDDKGALVGAFCINIDTTRVTAQINALAAMLPGIGEGIVPDIPDDPAEDAVPADGSRSVVEMVTDLIDKIIGEAREGVMSREKRLELIRFMDSRGVFLVKGAIDRVAEKLQISKVTVYSYLDEVRGKR